MAASAAFVLLLSACARHKIIPDDTLAQIFHDAFLTNAYIGSETPTFSVPRKDTPRVKIPRGAITIWQSQTTIFPMEQPGGWNVIGQTPLAMFLPDKKQPFFLHAGQWVHFYSIDEKTYDTISAAVANGTYRPEYAG
ncbi:MAG: carboxyltransferase domain-containing protein [Firmicutes bacterium]|nr:carboxyltransferase domain-containing protein [Bacillota bacterium]